MRLLGHLVAADLRRFGWLMAAWVTLVVAGVVVYAWMPIVAGTGGASEALRMTGGILWLARQVYRLMLIALIVHAHSTIGSTAFWMTRPIPPRVLAASKALLIGLVFVGTPVAADVALALKYSVPAGPLTASALQTALVNGLWVAVCLAVAVLTKSLAQFALVCGVAASSLVLVPFAIELLLLRRASDGFATLSDLAFSPALAVIAAVMGIAFLLAGAVVQYSRRRRPESIAVGVGGACLAAALALVPPPPFLLVQHDPPQWARGASLRVAPMSPTPWVSIGTGGATMPSANVIAMLAMPSLPRGWLALASLRDATVEVAGGSLDSRASAEVATVSRLAVGNEHPVRVALREALEVDRVVDSSYGAQSSVLFTAPASEAARLGSLRGQYHGRFQVRVAQLEAVGVLPILTGATVQDGAYRATVRYFRLDGPLTVKVQTSNTASLLPRTPRVEYEFYLRNRSTREAVVGNRRPARDYWVLPGATVLGDFSTIAPGVWTSADYLSYRGSPSLSAPGWELTEDWVRGAELVLVRTTYHAPIDAPLDIDAFTVTPSRTFPGYVRQRF